VARLRTRLELRQLPYDELKQGSALAIPYPDNAFDKVFSHGVLHHIPDIRLAEGEIARVLKPGGELIMMVYAKWSFNYLVAIGLLRRLGLLPLYGLNLDHGGVYGGHVANARRMRVGELSEDEQLHPPQHRWAGQSLFQGLWPAGSAPGLPLLPGDPRL
jgi:SAM-dependent methyltransferase